MVWFAHVNDWLLKEVFSIDWVNTSCQINHSQFHSSVIHHRSPFNPFPAGGGGQFDPPCSFFSYNSKSIGLKLLKFSDFSLIPKGLKPGFYTYCLSPQAWMTTFSCNKLNLCFDPLSVVRFWQFLAFLKAFDIKKRNAKVLKIICIQSVKRNLHIFSFS